MCGSLLYLAQRIVVICEAVGRRVNILGLYGGKHCTVNTPSVLLFPEFRARAASKPVKCRHAFEQPFERQKRAIVALSVSTRKYARVSP